MKGSRLVRINDEIQREVAGIVRGELKDPRIGTMVSVLRVETTQDLKFCKIFVSAMGNEDERREAFEGIRSAGGFIRRLLAERLNLRATPQLTFVLDDSIEHGIRISKLLDELNKDGGNE